LKKDSADKPEKEPFRLDKLVGFLTIVAIAVYALMIAVDYTGFEFSAFAQGIAEKFTGIVTAATDGNSKMSGNDTAENTSGNNMTATTQGGSAENKTISGKFTVCLDAALGGSDSGSSANSLVEKNVTLSVAQKVKDALEKSGVTVVMTRDSDKAVTNEARIQTCTAANADLMVSFRMNSAENTSVRGYEIWVNNKKPANSVSAAESIDKSLSAVTGIKSRGVKYGTVTDAEENYYVNSKSKCASLVIQLGFITNSDDAQLLKTNEADVAQKIAEGIVDYWNTAAKK
jgi:N-acetylmuramoyl-L-alanine amidase